MLNKQILSIEMLKFVPKLPWLQHGYMCTSWGHVTWLFLVGNRRSNHCDVTVRIVTLNSNCTLHQNGQKNIHYHSWETDKKNTNYLQWLNCLILNTPVFYLIFVIIILIRVCFLKLFQSWVLNNGTFQIINHLTNSAIPLKITFKNIDKKQLPGPVIHIFYLFIFSHWFSRCHEPYFPGSDTRPTQVRDMDPWPVTWPNLSDLIGWGQKISPTSWLNTGFIVYDRSLLWPCMV